MRRISRIKTNILLRHLQTDFKENTLFLFSVLFLLLLIVFVVATHNTIGGIRIDIPKGKAEVIVVKKEPIAISIKKEGTIYLDKDLIVLETIGKKINEITNNDKNIKIFILADKGIEYSIIIKVISEVYKIGFQDVSLVTDLNVL
ncbi:MAG: biopolymer transporter ExbD [Rickettsiales bacterium]|jgi:biopolymer transport protein TolR|nr:biopolymer transporter ExbD [Rickettsiales bacterium]